MRLTREWLHRSCLITGGGVMLVLAATVVAFVPPAAAAPSSAAPPQVAGTATSGPKHEVQASSTKKPPALDKAQLKRREDILAMNKPAGPKTPPVCGAAPPQSLPPAESTPPQAATDLTNFRVTDLGAGHGSLTNEPSVASNGVGVLETWNWYAARSTNGGSTFSYIDPYTQFPPSYGGFCCDQVVVY